MASSSSNEEHENQTYDFSIDEEDTDAYYNILGVHKQASMADIKAAYKRLSMIYHPDKQTAEEDDLRDLATEKFRRINEAYEVLSDEEKRAKYDVYGIRGLKLDVGPYMGNLDELKQRLEQAKKDKEMREQMAQTNAKSSITAKVDARGVFDDRFPLIECSKLVLSHSFQAPVTARNVFAITGSANTTDLKNFNSTYSVQYHHQLSASSFIELGSTYHFHKAFIFSLTGQQALTTHCQGGLTWYYIPQSHALPLGFSLFVTRMLSLDGQTSGTLRWNFPLDNSLSASITSSNKEKHTSISAELQAAAESSAQMTFSKRFPEHNVSVSVGAEASLDLSQFKPDAEVFVNLIKKVNDSNTVGFGLGTGTQGLSLKLIYKRDSHNLVLPLQLSSDFAPQLTLLSMAVPTLGFLLGRKWVYLPIKRYLEKRETEEKRRSKQKQLKTLARQARDTQRLMEASASKRRNEEMRKNGLVIVNAKYGNLSADDDEVDGEVPPFIDVTIPLQNMVHNSKLLIMERTKSKLDGFYDPCPDEPKTLRVIYDFQGLKHEVEIDDEEELKIPQHDHIKDRRV